MSCDFGAGCQHGCDDCGYAGEQQNEGRNDEIGKLIEFADQQRDDDGKNQRVCLDHDIGFLVHVGAETHMVARRGTIIHFHVPFDASPVTFFRVWSLFIVLFFVFFLLSQLLVESDEVFFLTCFEMFCRIGSEVVMRPEEICIEFNPFDIGKLSVLLFLEFYPQKFVFPRILFRSQVRKICIADNFLEKALWLVRHFCRKNATGDICNFPIVDIVFPKELFGYSYARFFMIVG